MKSNGNLAVVMPETEDEAAKEQQALAAFEEKAAVLTPTDEKTDEQCLLFISECKAAEKRLDARREELVRPHLDKQREINGAYKPVIDAFNTLWKTMDQRRSDYLKKKQQEIDEANRKAIADAEQARLIEEKKAEEARAAAASARESGDEKTAIKLELKADKAETKAMMTAPVLTTVSSPTAARSLGNGTKMGTRKTTDWLFTNGMPKDGDYYQDDPRVKDIPARYFILDLTKLGKDAKNGVPIPGVQKTEGFSTTSRG